MRSKFTLTTSCDLNFFNIFPLPIYEELGNLYDVSKEGAFSSCTHRGQLSTLTIVPIICSALQLLFYFIIIIIIIIIIFLHGLGHLTCSGIDALPSFPRASTISSSSRFVFEGMCGESGVVHSFKMVDPFSFAFGSHVLYSRDL